MAAHVPVLTPEVVRYLLTDDSGIVVDATVGSGGHAEAILDARPNVRLIGIDRDPDALARASRRLARFGDRVRLARALFSDLAVVLGGAVRVDGVFADLGVSSMQIDQPSRGFSYRSDGPLDMRMGAEGETAAELIARLDAKSLAGLLARYGEIRRAGRLARAIKAASERGRMESTADLRRTVEVAWGGYVAPATLSRVFQSFRIAVNRELDLLPVFLEAALDVTRAGGRLVVISYHSLEDRIVKEFLKREGAGCVCPPEAPVCTCGRTPRVEILTRRVVTPVHKELAANPRAHSARLRAARILKEGGAG